ncbi:MAG: class I SAM-dependent methyltransferase [Candidatus Andersenbacteria bacterium]
MDAKDMQFADSIPKNYDRYLGPLLFTFTSADTARRVAAIGLKTGKVLEIAAGTGITTEHMRNALPESVHIVATDISEAMLVFARQKRGHLQNVAWEAADAMDLLYEDNSFDAVVCQFGIMFFPDKEKGLVEMLRVLKPGGTLIINVWDSQDKNRVVRLCGEIIASFFETEPPTFLKIPFGFYDVDAITTMIEDAGFDEVTSEYVSETFTTIPASDIARGMVMGNPTIGELQKRGTTGIDTVVNAITEAIEDEFGKNTPTFSIQEIVFTAKKPF